MNKRLHVMARGLLLDRDRWRCVASGVVDAARLGNAEGEEMSRSNNGSRGVIRCYSPVIGCYNAPARGYTGVINNGI
jgi:hypothetical protein